MALNDELVQVHGSAKSKYKSLRDITTPSNGGELKMRNRSLSDISGEFCVQSLDSVDFWNDTQKSRKSSLNSIVSERPDSRISLVSNVTGFEEEIDAIRDFLQHSSVKSNRNNLGGYSDGIGNNPGISENCELSRRIIQLNDELMRSRSEVDKLKCVIEERENTARANEHLEKYNKQLAHELDDMKCKKSQLEACNRELHMQNNDLKVHIDCKESAVIGLKDKIREQYCQLEDNNMNIKQLESTCNNLKDELDIIKKSETWFRDEFHLCQILKTTLQERLITLENENLKIKSTNDRMKIDFRLLASTSQDVELKAKRDKENLLRKLKEIELRISVTPKRRITNGHQYSPSSNQNLEQMLEIESIKGEFETLKRKFELQLKHSLGLEEENAKIISALAAAKENTIKHELTNQMLEETINQLNEKNSVFLVVLESRNQEKIDLSNENVHLKSEIENVNGEKLKIDTIIQKLRADFDIISKRYLQMKDEVTQKSNMLAEQQSTTSGLNDQIAKLNTAENERNAHIIKLEYKINELEKQIQNRPKLLHTSTNTDSSLAPPLVLSTTFDEEKPSDPSDVQRLKTLIRVLGNEHKAKLKRYELNTRTLLKKVKEHMRAQKIAEKKAESISLLLKESTKQQIKYEELITSYSSLEFAHRKLQSEYSSLKSDHRDIITGLYTLHPVTSESNLKSLVNTTIVELRQLQKTNADLMEYHKSLTDQLETSVLKVQCIQNVSQQLTVAEGEIGNLKTNNNKLSEDLEEKVRIEIEIRDKLKNTLFELETLKLKHQSLSESLTARDSLLSNLQHSKSILQKDIDGLQTEVKTIHREKQQLQKLNNELRSNLNSIIECQRNLNTKSASPNNIRRTDFSKANEILKKCAKSTSTLEPLKDCVDSLKREMETLNSAIRQNNNLRREISLNDELREALEGER